MQLCLVGGIVAQSGLEVVAVFIFALDGTTEVAATIDNIPNPRETILIAAAAVRLTTHIDLCMTQNIGIGGTAKGFVDATIAQIDKGIATHIAFATTTIEEFSLGKILCRTFVGIDGRRAVKVHRSAVGWIELIFLSDGTAFTDNVSLLAYHT